MNSVDRRVVRRILAVTAFVFLPVVSGPALAADPSGEESSERSHGQNLVAGRIAQRAEVDPETLFALREQGIGWGDIEIATVVSEATSQPLGNIVDLWQTADRSWGVVAEEFDIQPLGQLISERKRARGRDAD